MSGMFEQKQDKAKRRLERAQKEEKSKKRTRIIAISVTTVFAVLLIVSLLVNSNYIRRVLPVITIDGVDFTTAEFEYFFNMAYMDYANFMSQFEGMGDTLPERGRLLSTQVYDPTTGETWADLISEIAFGRMANLASLYNAAKAAGFTLSDEQIAAIEEDVETVGIEAEMYGFPSVDSLLQQMYGNSINERVYRSILEFTSIASFYSLHVRDSFEYTTQQLDGFYAENADDLDVISYRALTIYSQYLDAEDYDDEDEFEAASALALADVYAIAAAIAETIASEEDFIAAAMEYEPDYYSEPDSTLRLSQGSSLDADTGPWLLETTRTGGDVTTIETEQGAIIVYFISRDNNDYQTVGMRQLLILRDYPDPDDYPDGEYDTDYLEALHQAETYAWERADLVNALFEAGGRTEAVLIDLIAEHSDDTTEGGYYTDISKYPYQGTDFRAMKVVEELEEWLFDESRAVGDSELIYTSDYGYHLVYFTGLGERFSKLIADDKMRTSDHDAWVESLPFGEPVKRGAFILVNI